MIESEPQTLARGSPELLELMIHVALVEEELFREPSCATTEQQIILEPLPLLGGQPFDLLREQGIVCRQISDRTHVTTASLPLPVVEALRTHAHDVVTLAELERAGQRMSDAEVLAAGRAEHREILTLDWRDFFRLHGSSRITKESLRVRLILTSPARPDGSDAALPPRASCAVCCESTGSRDDRTQPWSSSRVASDMLWWCGRVLTRSIASGRNPAAARSC
jgi:hypothetical protein